MHIRRCELPNVRSTNPTRRALDTCLRLRVLSREGVQSGQHPECALWTARPLAVNGMNFFLVYAILGLLVMLMDITKVASGGVDFREQMKVSLHLSDDSLPWLLFAMLMWILAWPILLVAQSGGPPTRGAT